MSKVNQVFIFILLTQTRYTHPSNPSVITKHFVQTYNYTISGCPDGMYGVDCAAGCGCRDPSEACDKLNGTCVSGCRDWFVGDACTTQIST